MLAVRVTAPSGIDCLHSDVQGAILAQIAPILWGKSPG
jgi:hypothetical protein